MEFWETPANAAISVPSQPFSEDELRVLAGAIFEYLDVPERRSRPAVKTALIDFFGTAKSLKTSTTAVVEQFFRRNGYHVFCPPETAEIGAVRSKTTDDRVVFQAIHVNGVMDYVLNHARDRNYHLVITNRGMIDMLSWYERWVRDGACGTAHRDIVRSYLYEFIRRGDLVDAFFFFTCSAEKAMRCEYGNAVLSDQGPNMNERTIRESHEIYRAVLEHVSAHIPNLPLFTVDTTGWTPKEAAEEVLRRLLPTLLTRYHIRPARFLPFAQSLLEGEAAATDDIEEQLKLRGHSSPEALEKAGWKFFGCAEHHDTYLAIGAGCVATNPTEPHARIRRIFLDNECKTIKFVYKTASQERLLLRRKPIEFEITETETENILAKYPILARVDKQRRYYGLAGEDSAQYRFTLCHDALDGIGNFTEIRARGSVKASHSGELLRLATELGFTPLDIMEGDYLALALSKQF